MRKELAMFAGFVRNAPQTLRRLVVSSTHFSSGDDVRMGAELFDHLTTDDYLDFRAAGEFGPRRRAMIAEHAGVTERIVDMAIDVYHRYYSDLASRVDENRECGFTDEEVDSVLSSHRSEAVCYVVVNGAIRRIGVESGVADVILCRDELLKKACVRRLQEEGKDFKSLFELVDYATRLGWPAVGQLRLLAEQVGLAERKG